MSPFAGFAKIAGILPYPFSVFSFFLVPLLLGLYYLRVHRLATRANALAGPESGTAPTFGPLPGTSAGFARYFERRAADTLCLVIEITDLAIKGHLRIESTGYRRYRVTVGPNTSEDRATLFPSQRALFEKLEKLPLPWPIPSGDGTPAMLEYLSRAYRKESRAFVKSNLPLWATSFAITALFLPIGYVSGEPLAGALSFACSAFLSAGFLLLLRQAPDVSGNRRRRKIRAGKLLGLAVLALLLLAAGVAATLALGEEPLVAVSCLFSAAAVPAFCARAAFPKEAGRELRKQIDSLRDYFTAPERVRQEMQNRPPEDTRLFETLLPWAAALASAENWTARMAPLLEESGHRPDWYVLDPRAWGGGNILGKLPTLLAQALEE